MITEPLTDTRTPNRVLPRKRLLLADDHQIFLEGLERLLQSDFDVVCAGGVHTSGGELAHSFQTTIKRGCPGANIRLRSGFLVSDLPHVVLVGSTDLVELLDLVFVLKLLDDRPARLVPVVQCPRVAHQAPVGAGVPRRGSGRQRAAVRVRPG